MILIGVNIFPKLPAMQLRLWVFFGAIWHWHLGILKKLHTKQMVRRSVFEMLDELEWPSLESRRERSSLTFFYKIHSGTVSLDKDKYLTPAPNLGRTRASHESQYTRPFAYSDALKNSFFPRTIPVWNSLPSSVVSSKTIEEFKASI